MHCTAVVAAPAANKAAFRLRGGVGLDGGTLTVQAFLPKAGATVHGIVTGGTGAYANARGTLVSRPMSMCATTRSASSHQRLDACRHDFDPGIVPGRVSRCSSPLLGIPGVTIAWDLPEGRLLDRRPARGRRDRPRGPRPQRTARVLPSAAIVLAAIEILFTATWTVLG